MRIYHLASLFLAVVTPAACGSGSGSSRDSGSETDSGATADAGADNGGSDGGSGAATLAEFCNSVRTRAGAWAARCFGGTAEEWAPLYALIDCQAATAANVAGRLTYDPDEGARCLARADQAACDQGPIPECQRAVAGTVQVGNRCSATNFSLFEECAAGGYCDLETLACGGTCRAYLQLGADCAGGECAPGSGCHPITGRCVADVGEGQPCLGATRGYCSEGLYCDGTSLSEGACRAQKTSGPCAASTECADNFTCIESACQRWRGAGESCTPGRGECLVSYCAPNGKCSSTLALENQACGDDANGEYVPCADGLYCTPAKVCAPTKPAGADCTSYGECGSFSEGYCDSQTKKCVRC